MATISMYPTVPADSIRPLALDFAQPFTDQVKAWFEEGGDLSKSPVVGLPGQAVAAVLTLPILEMACGLPQKVSLVGFGQDAKVVGQIDLRDYRHNVVRPRRTEQPDGEAFQGYTVLDGAGRGLTPVQYQELHEILNTGPGGPGGEGEIRVLNVSVGQVDMAHPEAGDPKKPEDLVGTLLATGITKADWISQRVLFLPPGLGQLAAVMATAIYGLSEVWPRTIRLNRGADSEFHVAEVVDPQALRQYGVALTAKWAAGNAPVSVPRDLFDRIRAALTGYAQECPQIRVAVDLLEELEVIQ